jgi:glutamate-5-semialdehyde dehydrogenase
MSTELLGAARAAKDAARILSSLDTGSKNGILQAIASALESEAPALCEANQRDLEKARSLAGTGLLKPSAVARLELNREKITDMVSSVRTVATLKDPVGEVLLRTELDDELELRKVSCPFGVVLAIVEARPDAIVQLSALALKSGNALMIKGGAEVANTAVLLTEIFHRVFEEKNVPRGTITNICGREAIDCLLGLPQYIDLVVPRGSSELIRYVTANTQIPVLSHADGVCHIYVEASADQEMAIAVILDSKTQAPSTCNAVETILVDEAIASNFLPKLTRTLRSNQVKLRGCEATRCVCGDDVELVTEAEWHTEYGARTLAIRVVNGCESAIDHINQHGSHHTDSIITEDESTANRFLREVDSAGVFHNVSTRFSDGYRYGFGAEVGISTGKLHARGPVGLESLVTYKYLLSGRGHCVQQYVGADSKPFKHHVRTTCGSGWAGAGR